MFSQKNNDEKTSKTFVKFPYYSNVFFLLFRKIKQRQSSHSLLFLKFEQFKQKSGLVENISYFSPFYV